MKILASLLFLFTVTGGQAAETVQAAAEPITTAVPLLSPQHVYNLLVYAICGSLGALGLLLGLDKVIIMLFRKGDGDAIQKYSSDSVARILPIVIEGITVILVVLTIIILGILRIITAEGTLGILGSVVGYVLGKSNRKSPPPKNGNGNA
ncbi:hypothetical protein DES53_102895 [Roseimicrobium gellanilyticum]|uniref:Uncharacterized protein n=1 Tax=Roseimicrobium gellanilyticum TaxID=748857 RepID=A0A366HUC0_9BACT|nr:hypothetical protein [Roseimicrobium gellanilyticum]RBP46504.1 hypothetical protein DES53_102895 [Roseimicrobium gellanilyticum]